MIRNIFFHVLGYTWGLFQWQGANLPQNCKGTNLLGRYGKVQVIWVFIIICTSQIQTFYAILLKFNRFDYLWALLEKTIRKKREILHEKISHWLMKPSKFSSHAGYFLQIFVNQKRCFFRRHENWIWLHNWFLIYEFTIRY